MSDTDENNMEQRDIMMAPGKMMFFSWLNNLFLKKQARFHPSNYNIIELESFPSTWFCIGRDNEDKSPFIGIQEHMVPWFFEAPWQYAFVVQSEGKLYLTCGDIDNNVGDFTLSIKIRKKRLRVLWSKETQRHLDFRIIKVNSNNDVSVSEKVYKRCPLRLGSSYQDVVAQSDFSFESKTDEFEEEIKERYNEKYVQANKKTNEDDDE